MIEASYDSLHLPDGEDVIVLATEYLSYLMEGEGKPSWVWHRKEPDTDSGESLFLRVVQSVALVRAAYYGHFDRNKEWLELWSKTGAFVSMEDVETFASRGMKPFSRMCKEYCRDHLFRTDPVAGLAAQREEMGENRSDG